MKIELIDIKITDSLVPSEYQHCTQAVVAGNNLCAVFSPNGGGVWWLNPGQFVETGARASTDQPAKNLREMLGQNIRTLHVEFT